MNFYHGWSRITPITRNGQRVGQRVWRDQEEGVRENFGRDLLESILRLGAHRGANDGWRPRVRKTSREGTVSLLVEIKDDVKR